MYKKMYVAIMIMILVCIIGLVGTANADLQTLEKNIYNVDVNMYKLKDDLVWLEYECRVVMCVRGDGIGSTYDRIISVEQQIEDEYKKLNELLKSKIKILEASLDKNIDERRKYLKLLQYDRSLHSEYDLAIQKGFEINYDLKQTKSRLKEVDNYFIKREIIVKHLKDKSLELDNIVKPLKSLSLKEKLSHESKAVQQPAVQQPAVQQPAVQPDSALGGREEERRSSDSEWMKKPTFGLSHHTHKQLVESGFGLNGNIITITDNFHTEFEKITGIVGDENHMTLTVYAENNLQSIFVRFGVYEVGMQDRRYNVWSDDEGYEYERNDFGTFIQKTFPEFYRYHDDTFMVMTRTNSNFEKIIEYEKNRAVLVFDSSKIAGFSSP